MNIYKALDHFEYKFRNSWKPTEADIKAFNAIVRYKKLQEAKTLQQNELLAKLWIHQLILFSRTGGYNGERSIQVLDEILSASVYEWCLVLKDEIPMMRFGSIGSHKYPLEPKDYYNFTKLKNRNKKIIDEFETELTKAMKHEVTEENIIKFVKTQINRIINKFEK
jgi:hypothetical protein